MVSNSILGTWRSDFARNLRREELDVADLTREAVHGVLDDAGIGADAIESIHVGNAFGGLYNGQTHLGAMPATVVPELWGVPASRHEGACASSSLALLAATAEIEAGRYDCVLVLGVEQERTMNGADAARVQEAAAWVGHETEGIEFIWPETFDRIAAEYDARYGVDEAHLREIGRINLENAQDNPNAQTRKWQLSEASFGTDDHVNPVVTGRLRRNDCCQITDGAAAVLLVSDRWLAANGRTPKAVVAGWGHQTVGLPLQAKLDHSAEQPFVMPHVRTAITDARRRAGVDDVAAFDSFEVHDCMTPSEYLAIDHLGLTAPGESWKAVESGAIRRDGATPVNPAGGLIGGGHPVGATGARMVCDAVAQVTGNAGAAQIDGAHRVQTVNIGGSTATTVSLVIEGVAE